MYGSESDRHLALLPHPTECALQDISIRRERREKSSDAVNISNVPGQPKQASVCGMKRHRELLWLSGLEPARNGGTGTD
ncbi:hypothetical protein BaRGS_00000801 [Batillaria attramentaria]|uniref:Uncharacterized protein n=1 Tax=Batillaria attramentaria TaxID=370345 RepID=A0ABD0M8S8_9CAEN